MRTRVRNRPFLRAGGGFDPGDTGLDLFNYVGGDLPVDETEIIIMDLAQYASLTFQFYDLGENLFVQLIREGQGGVPDSGAVYSVWECHEDGQGGNFGETAAYVSYTHAGVAGNSAWIHFDNFGFAMRTIMRSGSNGIGTATNYKESVAQHEFSEVCEGLRFYWTAPITKGKGRGRGRKKGKK